VLKSVTPRDKALHAHLAIPLAPPSFPGLPQHPILSVMQNRPGLRIDVDLVAVQRHLIILSVTLSNNDGCAVVRSAEAKALNIKMGELWF
jgi:hypothetical protein